MSAMSLHSVPLEARATLAPSHVAMIKRFAMIAMGFAAMAALVATIAVVKLAIFYPRIFH